MLKKKVAQHAMIRNADHVVGEKYFYSVYLYTKFINDLLELEDMRPIRPDRPLSFKSCRGPPFG